VTVTEPPEITDESAASDDVRIIAKASKTIIVLVALLAVPAIWTAIQSPSLLAFAWLVPHAVFVLRVKQLGLTVSSAGVTIRNFLSSTTIPVWEAEVEVRKDKDSILLSDSGGKLDTEGRTLYIRRAWRNEDEVQVGIAPRFGREFDRIHDELVSAIALQRAA